MSSSLPLRILSHILNLCMVGTTLASSTINLNKIVSKPSPGRQSIDPSYQAFSIEFCFFLDYTENSTYTNELNVNLVNNIRHLGGAPIYVRVGGASQNFAYWIANQTVGLAPSYAPGADAPYNISVGLAFFESFSAWPSDTQYIFGEAFNYSTFLLPSDEILAEYAYKTLGERLYAYEIGNEFDTSAWNTSQYVDVYLPYATNVSETVFGNDNERRFQIAVFTQPTCENSTECWTPESILELGIDRTNLARSASMHQYMGGESQNWTTAQFLMNHNNTAGMVDVHAPLADGTVAVGIPYVIGETNSYSGHGRLGVSDSYAAALWSIDYVLYSATTNISRLYFHQGTGWKYSAWNPVQVNSISAGVKGPYYSWLFTAAALHGGDKKVEILVGNQTFTAYAIYACDRLESIVAINLEAWSVGQGETNRTGVEVRLPEGFYSRSATVKRLTAPGVDVYWGITFAEQGVDVDGKINGTETVERLENGQVTVAASEAILITL